MAGSDASEGQAVWQPGGAEEDSRLREGNRHLHLAYDEEEEGLQLLPRGRNSSVGSAWARCPQRHGFDPPLGTFSVEGIFSLELTWVQTPFPPKLLRMRV